MRTHESDLRQSLQALDLNLPDSAVHQLLDYLDMIQKWNSVYNLSAVRDPAEMLRLHLIDSLVIVPPLLRQTEHAAVRLLDVGSGAGLPGVVVAIACPQIQVTCVDAVGKKAAFIQQVAHQLKLPNLQGLHSRIEALKVPAFDVITSRAFSSLVQFFTLTQPHAVPATVWLAMKGQIPHEEITALPPEAEVFHVEQLSPPQLDAQRCIVWLRQVANPS